MVNIIQNSANEQMRNALFNYLNLNRHKFDDRGRIDTTPDAQDYVPLEMVRWTRAVPPSPEINWDPWLQLGRKKLTTLSEEQEEQERIHRDMADRGELTPEQCQKEYDKEYDRCGDRWKGRARRACESRAADRLRNCRQNGRYTAKEWGWEDMDIPEIEKEEFRKRFGKQNRTSEEEQSSGPHETPWPAKPESAHGPSWAVTPPVPSKAPTARKLSERNPYVFGPPGGSPIIYRAPLMPPELQRQISWNLGVHIPPEQMIQILATILSRGAAARSASVRGAAKLPVLPILKGAPQ